MILEIERSWGKYPGWFGELDADDRIDVMALYAIEHPLKEEE